MLTQKVLNDLSYKIIGYAIEVHRELGPGLLESVYEKCLVHLLIKNGHKVKQQNKVSFNFQDIIIDTDLRFDLLVDDLIIVELKTTERIISVNESQTLTYMRLLEKPKGIIINFNCTNIFKEGQKTLVNKYYEALPKGY